MFGLANVKFKWMNKTCLQPWKLKRFSILASTCQTFACHEGCEQLGIMHLLHITPTIKLLDEIIQLNGANHP
jgi:hypothetical protein